MSSPEQDSATPGRWISLWVVALLSLTAQLWLCQFFTFGQKVPLTTDINTSNLWEFTYGFPPTGTFQVLHWLGEAYPPQPLNPFSLAANLPNWFFFTAFAPFIATCALLAMAAFLRELEISRPAALVGAVVYAWQGDLLPFLLPGHFLYITTWPFFALAAWATLRAQRTRHWAYAVISGTNCGLLVALPSTADRGAISCLFIAAIYLAAAWRVRRTDINVAFVFSRFRLRFPAILGLTLLLAGAAFVGWKLGPLHTLRSLADWGLGGIGLVIAVALIKAARTNLPIRHLIICASLALMISLASFLALFQTNIVGVKLAGVTDRNKTYNFVTQFSLSPEETLTYPVPGFFGWHTENPDGPYWGSIGERPDYEKDHDGPRNFNIGISTTGTVASVLALIGAILLLPGHLFGPDGMTARQRFFGRVLLGLGFLGLVLAWGWHTPLYRPLFELPLMDKWRNPLKWLEMTNFAMVTLAAFGAHHLVTSLDLEAPGIQSIRRRLGWFTGIVTGLFVLGWMASFIYTYYLLAFRLLSEKYDPGTVANIVDTLHFSLVVAIACMAGFCVLLYALWRPDWLRRFSLVNPLLDQIWRAMLRPSSLGYTLALGLSLLCTAQLGWVATHFILPASLADVTRSNPLLDTLAGEDKDVRVKVAEEDPLLNQLLLKQFAGDRISTLDVSAASRIPDDVEMFINRNPVSAQARLWFLTGVKDLVMPASYVLQMQSDPSIATNVVRADGYTLEDTGAPNMPSHSVVVMRDYMAKATLVSKAELIPDDTAMLKRVRDPAWNPRATVLLHAPPAVLPNFKVTGPGDQPDQIELKAYTPTEIDVDVQTDRGGFLLINDKYDPDWEVKVNGRDVELLRADYMLRAVVVPPGDSTVRMRYVCHYRIHYRFIDLALPASVMHTFSDGVMLLSWIIAGLALWRRNRNTES